MQSDVRTGPILVESNEDLSSSSNRLGVLLNNSGLKAALPSATTDHTLHLIEIGRAQGEKSVLLPLAPDTQVRVVAKGAINPGDVVVMADPGTAADKGKVRALPGTTGTFKGVGIYEGEKAAADGDLALIRPVQLGDIDVA